MQVTYFADHQARTTRTADVSLADLRDLAIHTTAPAKSQLPWIKCATFGTNATPRGSLRHNANLLAITGVEADYDLERLSIDDAAAMLQAAGVQALLYTSPSHIPDFPRWRVLAPTSHALPPAARAELVGRLNHVLGGVLSVESFTLSQAYYYGQTPDSLEPVAVLLTGQCIDLLDLPARYPDRATIQPLVLPPPPPGQTADERAIQAMATAVGAFTNPNTDRHHVLLSVTNTVAPFVKSGHLDLEEAQDAFRDAMAVSGRDANPGEVEGAMSGALRMAVAYVPATGGAEFPVVEVLEPGPVQLLEITEDHAARTYARAHHAAFKFDHSAGQWFKFGPDGWDHDQKASLVDAVRTFLHTAREQWGLEAKEAIKAAGASFIHNVVSLCKSDPFMATAAGEWDLDPMLLGIPGGHVDLRTGEMCRADPARLMRRRCTVAPSSAPAPVWRRFLHEATGGDIELQAWLQRFAGYVLTGDVSEEMLAFVYGPGKNGKGVFLGALSAILGNYAYQAPAALFDANDRENKSYQLANLEGIRLLMVSETEAGSVMAEAFVKELTGNEGKLNARQIYGKPFTFRSQAKVLIVGNHAPKLNGRSEAMERRLRVVPFNNKPPVQDTTLKDRLVAEHPMILAWMIDGCVSWQAERLGVCGAVKGASASYFEAQDTLSQWVAERCDLSDHKARTSTTALLEDWNGWLRDRGEKQVNARNFKETMEQRLPHCEYTRTKTGSVIVGVSLCTGLAGLLN